MGPGACTPVASCAIAPIFSAPWVRYTCSDCGTNQIAAVDFHRDGKPDAAAALEHALTATHGEAKATKQQQENRT
jgi:hypothetical protein